MDRSLMSGSGSGHARSHMAGAIIDNSLFVEAHKSTSLEDKWLGNGIIRVTNFNTQQITHF